MARHLNQHEIQKRLVILRARLRDQSTSYRALARRFQTSLRVVCDAMTRSVAEWREELARQEMGRVPVVACPVVTSTRPASSEQHPPGQGQVGHREGRMTVKRGGYDPEHDFDPDELTQCGTREA